MAYARMRMDEDFIYVEGYFDGKEDDTYWLIIDRKTSRLVKTNRPESIFFIRNLVDNITDIYETAGTLPEERWFVWY